MLRVVSYKSKARCCAAQLKFPHPAHVLPPVWWPRWDHHARESLLDALKACRNAYAYRDAVYIDWEARCGRTDRRQLNLWTRFVLAQPAALSPSSEQSIQLLDQCLQPNAVAPDRILSRP